MPVYSLSYNKQLPRLVEFSIQLFLLWDIFYYLKETCKIDVKTGKYF